MAKTFCKIIQDGSKLSFVLNPDSETPLTYEVDCDEFPEEIQDQLRILGAVNKLRDSYASAKGDSNVALDNLKRVHQNLLENQWAGSRASGTSAPRTLELANAIARLQNTTPEKIQAILDNATQEDIKTWKAHPQVKMMIQTIRAEKAREALENSTPAALAFPSLGQTEEEPQEEKSKKRKG